MKVSNKGGVCRNVDTTFFVGLKPPIMKETILYNVRERAGKEIKIKMY